MAKVEAIVTSEIQREFACLSRAQGRTVASMLRWLIEQEVKEERGGSTSIGDPAIETRTRIVKLYLNAHENAALDTHAQALGMTRPGVLVAILRANLFKTPQLYQEEIAAVEEATRALEALGRNVNQIARKLHEAPNERDQVRELAMSKLATMVKQETTRIHALCNKSLKRWSP